MSCINGFGDAGGDRDGARGDREGLRRQGALFRRRHDASRDESAAMVDEAEGKLGSVDILVNNAGIQFVSPIEEFPPEKWDQIIAINLSVGLSCHARRHSGHEGAEMGPHHLDGFGAFAGRLAVQVRLCLGQTRHRRPDQDGGAGDSRPSASPSIASRPGYVWTPLVEQPDPRHHEGAPPDARTGDQRRAAGGPADQAIRHLDQVAALAVYLCSDAARRSPAPISRSTAAGRPNNPAALGACRDIGDLINSRHATGGACSACGT